MCHLEQALMHLFIETNLLGPESYNAARALGMMGMYFFPKQNACRLFMASGRTLKTEGCQSAPEHYLGRVT